MLNHRSLPITMAAWLATAGLASSFARANARDAGQEAPAGPDLLAALALELSGRRLVEPRLSIDFGFAECTLPSGNHVPADVSCGGLPQVESPQFLRLMPIVARITRADGLDGQTLALPRSVWAIVSGSRGGALDRAVDELKLLAGTDGSAPLLSDLAAAYLVRAGRQDEIRDLLAGLEAADRAVELAPTYPQAQFNLALALERLGLAEPARMAWRSYLQLDDSGSWAVEARRRVDRLGQAGLTDAWPDAKRRLADLAESPVPGSLQPVVRGHAQQTRLLLEDTLLPGWGRATVSADQAAASYLTRARLVANELGEATSDNLLAASVGVIEQATASPVPEARALLAQGHADYARARVLYEQQNHDQARPVFEEAERLLQQAGSPFALWAAFYRGVCDQHATRYQGALEGFRQVIDDATVRGYVAVRAHAEWMSGLTYLEMSRPADSIRLLLAALRDFETIHEGENIAAMHNLLSRAHEYLGNDSAAWRERAAAISRLPEVAKDRRISNILSSVVDGADSEGRLIAARYFQREQVRQARFSGNALLTAIALHKEAALSNRLGDQASAVSALAEAVDQSRRIAGSGVRARVTGDILLVKGQTLRDSNPTAALAALRSAQDLFEQQGARVFLLKTHRLLAGALAAQGNLPGAESELTAATEEAMAQLSGVPPEGALAFAAELREVWDDLVRARAASGSSADLLVTVEAGRDAVLFAQSGAWRQAGGPSRFTFGPSESGRTDVATLAAALPPATAALVFRALPDKTLCWLLTPTGAVASVIPASQEALAEEISSLQVAIRRRLSLSELRPALMRLSTQLLSPLADLQPQVQRLVIIPDGVLTGVPFDALPAPGTDQTMLERFQVVTAPSLRLYFECSARLRALRELAPQTVVAVGDPTFDRELFTDLPQLPQSALEARAVGGVYREARVLIGPGATRAALLDAVRDAQVLHFSGHAILNAREPLRSSVLLASDRAREHSGLLMVRDLPNLAASLTLVVLSACDTAGSTGSNGAGVQALLLPFLDAGVPSAIATLWPVDDRSSARLMQAFHREVAAGVDPATALRHVKIASLRDAEPNRRVPAEWASFTSIGGVAGDA